MSNAKMMDHDEMQILRESLSFNVVSDEELRKAGVYEHFALVNRWLTAKGWNHIAAFEMQGLYVMFGVSAEEEASHMTYFRPRELSRLFFSRTLAEALEALLRNLRIAAPIIPSCWSQFELELAIMGEG